MSNMIKVGRIDINLDALKSVSRSVVDQMYSKQSDSWKDALWSHLEMLNPPKVEELPKKKKKKSKEGEE